MEFSKENFNFAVLHFETSKVLFSLVKVKFLKSYRIVMLHEVTMIAVCSVEMVIIGHQAPQMSFKNIQKHVFIIFHTQRIESYKVPSGYGGCLRPKIFRTRLSYYIISKSG